MSEQPQRPVPRDPLEHRQEAEQLIDAGSASSGEARLHALLAIAGELHEIRKLLRKGR
ncbi:hypothetical protein ACIP96_06340 [Streptomyces nigra]|uniref:hypothetical protein n=1 Tax=Streptomyces nigra TaxID=1827580 RepID=UPI0037F7687E